MFLCKYSRNKLQMPQDRAMTALNVPNRLADPYTPSMTNTSELIGMKSAITGKHNRIAVDVATSEEKRIDTGCMLNSISSPMTIPVRNDTNNSRFVNDRAP